MNPYIKMYLISEGDHRLLETLKAAPTQQQQQQSSLMDLGTPSIQLHGSNVTPPFIHDGKPHDDDDDHDSDHDSTMDAMYHRLQDLKHVPTTPILPPPTTTRRKPPRLRDQLEDCKRRLNACLRIRNWQTIDGRSFTAAAAAATPARILKFDDDDANITPMPANLNKQRKRKATKPSPMLFAASTPKMTTKK